MDSQRLSAILLLAAFVGSVIGTAAVPPGFYETEDSEHRLQLVSENRSRWNITNISDAIGVLLPALAFGILNVYLRRQGSSQVTATLGALAFAAGSMFGTILLYVRNADLVGFFEGRYPDYHGLANGFWLGGLILLGFAFLQAGLPTWLAYLTVGVALVLATAWLILPALFWLVPFPILFVLVPAIGIVLLRR